MPQLNFKTPALNSNDQPIMDNGKPVMVNEALASAVASPTEQSQSLGFDKIAEYGALARKIHQCDEQTNYSLDEINIIRSVGKNMTPLFAYQIKMIIDPPAKPKE